MADLWDMALSVILIVVITFVSMLWRYSSAGNATPSLVPMRTSPPLEV